MTVVYPVPENGEYNRPGISECSITSRFSTAVRIADADRGLGLIADADRDAD